MRQSFDPPKPKEYILDVTKSFAYEVHCQPKRIVHTESRTQVHKLSKQLQGALRRLLRTMSNSL